MSRGTNSVRSCARSHRRQFSFDDFLMSLREAGLCLYAQSAGVVQEFVHTFVGNFSIQYFTDPGLRLSESWVVAQFELANIEKVGYAQLYGKDSVNR
jgi:hypothetical protein